MTAWTQADQAELDLLVHKFVACVGEHRARCAHCRQGGPWCAPVRDAFEAILTWRQGRVLLTRAAVLRARQDLIDLTTEAPERAADRKEAAA